MPSIIKRALAALVALYKRQPVRFAAVVASVVVFIAAKVGIVIPQADILQALAYVLPTLFGGEVARRAVTPIN